MLSIASFRSGSPITVLSAILNVTLSSTVVPTNLTLAPVNPSAIATLSICVAVAVMLVPVETIANVAAVPATYFTASSQVTLTVTATAPVYAASPHLTLVIVGRCIPVDVYFPASPPIATRTSS